MLKIITEILPCVFLAFDMSKIEEKAGNLSFYFQIPEAFTCALLGPAT